MASSTPIAWVRGKPQLLWNWSVSVHLFISWDKGEYLVSRLGHSGLVANLSGTEAYFDANTKQPTLPREQNSIYINSKFFKMNFQLKIVLHGFYTSSFKLLLRQLAKLVHLCPSNKDKEIHK